MHITYLGHSCFKLQDKIGPEGITLVTDPFDPKIGLKAPNFEADIVTVSHDHYDHNNVSSLRGQPIAVNTPGEYDIKGVAIEGIDSMHNEKEKNIIFRISMDDLTIVHLGDLGQVLDAKQLERLEGTDILMIPVGGKYTLDAKKAVEVVNQIEPRMVIPMHYRMKGAKITDIDEVDKFIKEIGLKPNNQEKLKISKKDLPQEDTELVIFSV